MGRCQNNQAGEQCKPILADQLGHAVGESNLRIFDDLDPGGFLKPGELCE